MSRFGGLVLDDKYLFRLSKGETFSIVSQDGSANENDPGLPDSLLLKMYRLMMQARAYDDKAMKLQRSGRMGTYPPISGQEAVQVGSALALGDGDWMVPSYRDQASMMVAGIPLKSLYMLWMGNDYGNKMPAEARCLPATIPVGSQMLHATGFAWAAKIKKEKIAVIVYFGDGATSRGDFHAAMNFAGVFQVPVVFLCSNNQFAISTRIDQQTHAETLAQKGIAYGIPGYRLDGMDVLATYVMVKDAMDRARDGGGPVFIEGLCYRFGPHTTSDNPDLYRSPKEVEKAMKESDPIARFHNYLVRKKLWDADQEKRLKDELADGMNRLAKEAEEAPAPPFDELFESVFATMPGYLKDELDYYHRVSGGR